MRKWGYGLAGILALALFAGVANPDDPQTEDPVSSVITPTQEPEAPETNSTEQAQVDEAEIPVETNEAPEPNDDETAEPSPSPTVTPSQTQPAATAAPQDSGLGALLAQLIVEEEFSSGYDRDLFTHWVDEDRDGCDARREVLIIEAVVPPTVGDGCSLSGGSWYSAFDGVPTENPSEFDIDHLVPLKEAWDSGAHGWDSERRREFANDLELPQSLIAVSRSSNRSKGADDPADWLPPLVSYHCQYIEDWMAVKINWDLSVDAREFNALRAAAANC